MRCHRLPSPCAAKTAKLPKRSSKLLVAAGSPASRPPMGLATAPRSTRLQTNAPSTVRYMRRSSLWDDARAAPVPVCTVATLVGAAHELAEHADWRRVVLPPTVWEWNKRSPPANAAMAGRPTVPVTTSAQLPLTDGKLVVRRIHSSPLDSRATTASCVDDRLAMAMPLIAAVPDGRPQL